LYAVDDAKVMAVLTLREAHTFDAATEVHYACLRSMRVLSEPHDHDFFEIFLVTRGQICHLVNGERQLLQEGALVLVRPTDCHCYEKVDGAELELINLAYSSRTHQAITSFLGAGPVPEGLLTADLPPHRQLPPEERETLAERLRRLGPVPATDKPRWKAAVRALLADIFARYFAGPAEALPARPPAWFTVLARAMAEPENFTASLPRLLALSPVSQEHLSRTVRRYTGKTPTEWLNEMRLQYAAWLLMSGDELVTEVALQAGFENLSHFYHLFRRAYGVSPARYRRATRRVVAPAR